MRKLPIILLSALLLLYFIPGNLPAFQLEVFVNSLGMKFVKIPSGSFMMGSEISPSEVASQYGGWSDWYKGEQPQHRVTITKPFYIKTTEVTNIQNMRVMTGKHTHSPSDDCPAISSWHGAQEFVRKLNKREGTSKYRLPTEAEWEYACRAGSTTSFSFGNDKDRLGEYAWYGRNSGGKTHPVAQKKPNSWGLYDMHGNVFEWCQDRYGKYPSGAVTDPKGPSSGSKRVFRGGGWKFDASFSRSAYRDKYKPWVYVDYVGFRLVRDP